MARNRSYQHRDLPPNLYVRNGYYSYRDPHSGKEFGLGRNKREAITQVIEVNMKRIEEQGSVRLIDRIACTPLTTVNEWVLTYYKILEARNLRPNTMKNYTVRINAFAERFGERDIASLSTRDIASYLNELVDRGAATYAKFIRSNLKDFFREAIAEGVIESNPVDATRSPRMQLKRHRLTFNEYLSIRESAKSMRPWVGLSMDLGVITGQRVSDISAMRWDAIKDELLFVEQIKTGAKVAIPLSLWLDEAKLRLSDILEECRKISKGDFILSSARKTRIPAANISTHFASARNASGLTWENDPPPFHELRSLSARLHAKQRSDEFAQHLLGHKSREMSEKYRDTRGSEWDIISS